MASILVIDPDPDERGLIAFALRFAGHQVLEAAGLQEAMQPPGNRRPDLLVLDQSLSSLHQGELWQDLPVVIITKPVSPDELTHKVNLALKRSSGRGKTPYP